MSSPEEEDDYQHKSRSSSACCQFKGFLMRSDLTLTRAHGKDHYFKYAERYETCSRCSRDLHESRKYCDNPFDSHRPGKILRHSIVPVTGNLANFDKYPAFKFCSYVCVFCVYKAKKMYKQSKEDRRLLDETKPKIKACLKERGLSKEDVKKGIIQIMTKPRVPLSKIEMFNHWNHNDWDRSICMESSDLPISEDTIDILPQEEDDDQTKNQVDASYFLKHPALKTNKPAIESDVQTISRETQFYSVGHTLQTNTNQEFISNEFDTIDSNSEIKKIQKRHSLPTPVAPQHNNYLKRSRSKSDDFSNNYMNKSISPIKITLTRDQCNQQNWIATKSHESSSISEYDNLEKTAHKLNCFTEKTNLKQKTLVSNKQHTEVKTSCNITIGVTKIQSCSDKTVPELENNDYISKPVISDNFIGKQNLEDHLSPFLKSRVKRLHHPSESVDVLRSNFTSKRPKLSEHTLDTNANINININYIDNCLDHRNKQERRSVELSQSFNDYSKKDLPKNLENNVSNLNISLSYSDNYKKRDMIHIRSQPNRNLQIDHNSNIAKGTHTKQKISSPERRKSDERSRRKKRKSVEMDERKKKKIGHKFAEIFGDSDSDALEIIHSPSNLVSSEKSSSNDNYINSYDGNDSDANCETNTVRLDKSYINTTLLEKSYKASEIESVLDIAEKCTEIPTDHLELEPTKHLSSSIQENQDFEESVKITEPTTLNVNKSRELSNKDVQSEKSYENSMTPEKMETNPTENCITKLFSEKTSDTLSKTSENNFEICETYTNSVKLSTKTNEFPDKCVSEVQLDVPSENISSNTTSEINLLKTMTEKNLSTSITEKNSSEIIRENQVEIRESYTDAVTASTKTNEFPDKCVSEVQLNVPSENISLNTSEINLSKTMIEENSSTSITEENSSEITSKHQDEICKSYTDAVTASTKTNEFPDKCVSKVQLNVPSENISLNTSEINLSKTMIEENSSTSITKENSSEITSKDQELCNLNGTNCDLSNNNSVETMDLQEGDFDFQVDNHSVCSYDDCVYSDATEPEDLADSYRVTIQSSGDNESTNNEIPISKNQQLLVSERSEFTTEQNNDHCLDNTSTYFDDCGAEVSNEISDSSGNNNKEATAKDSKNDNIEENDDYDSDNQLIICESPIQNQVLSSTILSPNQNSPTFGNGEIFDDNINQATSLLSSNSATEPSSTVSLPDRNVFEDLKNPNILKKYNLFQEEIIPEEITSETESIENLEEQQAFESLNKTNRFLETSTSENISEHSNRLTNEQIKSSVEKFKKFNIHYVDIDTDEIINSAKSTDNISTVNSFPGTLKVRNINELLEKPQTSSQTNMNSTNEKTASKVETTQTENNYSNFLESILNSTSSAFDQLILMVNSIPFTTQILSPVGINNIPNIVPQTNNQSCEKVLSANSLSQSMTLPNDSQVCIKLASNMFSNEFSTADELPTIFSMESPPLDILKLLLPVTTKEDVDEYKKLLIYKMDSLLESLQTLSGKDFVKFSNDLLKYNTLSEDTWKFQEVILTITQCISRLIYCAAGENKGLIIKIIEKTTNLSKYKQICLKDAIVLYQKLSDQGLFHKHIFLYDPLLIEVDALRSSIPNKDFKMNDSQMTTYFEHITFYRTLQKLPCLEISYLKTVASGSTTTPQINSFQSFSTTGVQLTVPNLQNAQISQQVQCNQTMSIPSCVPQTNSMQIPLLPMQINSLPQQVCSLCKKANCLIFLCESCKNVKYCSRNCQTRDWEKHSKTCKII